MGCVFGGEGTIILNLPRCVGGVSVCVCSAGRRGCKVVLLLGLMAISMSQ